MKTVSNFLLAVAFLITFCSSNRSSQTQVSAKMRKMFESRVQLQGYFLSFVSRSLFSCAAHCGTHEECLSFGHSETGGRCWLYDHMAPYRVRGPPAPPGTSYFWRLAPSCPTHSPSNYSFLQEDALCYKVYRQPRTWPRAAQRCSQDGGHLFVADTAHKRQILREQCDYALLVGGYDDEIEGQWWWWNGKNHTFDWAQGQPDNSGSGQHFAQLWPSGKLDDQFESMERQFAC